LINLWSDANILQAACADRVFAFEVAGPAVLTYFGNANKNFDICVDCGAAMVNFHAWYAASFSFLEKLFGGPPAGVASGVQNKQKFAGMPKAPHFGF
jgi:hypothetical protein